MASQRKRYKDPKRLEYNRKGLVEYRKTERYQQYRRRDEVQQKIRLSSSKGQAERKDRAWHVSDARAAEIVHEDAVCHHCGRKNPAHLRGLHASTDTGFSTPLGFDRIDPKAESYTDEGVVPACSQCNMCRGTLSMPDFYRACANVALYHTLGITASIPVSYRGRKRAASFTSYKSRAIKKGLCFELDACEFARLCASPCYLCGIRASRDVAVGVDRVDNGQGYTHDNARPCCSTCNYLKRSFSLDDTRAMCAAVHALHRVPKGSA